MKLARMTEVGTIAPITSLECPASRLVELAIQIRDEARSKEPSFTLLLDQAAAAVQELRGMAPQEKACSA